MSRGNIAYTQAFLLVFSSRRERSSLSDRLRSPPPMGCTAAVVRRQLLSHMCAAASASSISFYIYTPMGCASCLVGAALCWLCASCRRKIVVRFLFVANRNIEFCTFFIENSQAENRSVYRSSFYDGLHSIPNITTTDHANDSRKSITRYETRAD